MKQEVIDALQGICWVLGWTGVCVLLGFASYLLSPHPNSQVFGLSVTATVAGAGCFIGFLGTKDRANAAGLYIIGFLFFGLCALGGWTSLY